MYAKTSRMIFKLISMILWLKTVLVSSLNNAEMVRVGDRNLTLNSWLNVKADAACWGSTDGKWTKNDETHGSLYSTVYGNDEKLVTKVYSLCGPVQERQGLDYHWQPGPTCPQMEKFSPKSMCEIMRGRSLIFIGDSLSLHTYETTVNAIGNRSTYGYAESPDRYWEHYQHCESNKWGKNYVVTYIKWNSIDDNRRSTVLAAHTAAGGSVIVANWGAFYKEDEVVRTKMHETLAWIDEELPTSLFVFRSSNMAHLDCDNYKLPDNVDHEPAQHSVRANFHWAEFPPQNRLWKEELDQNHPGKMYMNIFDLIRKRPDQHPGEEHNHDCLHYCIPGPVDAYVELLHAILRRIADSALPVAL
jgi:hypothetical protein